MPGEPDDLTNLREAVMKASTPKPGRHLAAILVVSAWEKDDDPTDAVADFIGTPPDGMMKLIRIIQDEPFPRA